MTTRPRVLILAPHLLPRVRGNAVTAERWRHLLTIQGLPVQLLETDNLDTHHLIACIEDFSPEIIHGHHAVKAGHFFLDPPIAERYADLPLVISLAGTDISFFDREAETVSRVLRRAAIIISQNPWFSSRLQQIDPDFVKRTHTITKSVFFTGHTPYDLRKLCGWQATDTVFFLPAGIRPVKGNLECLLALEHVWESRPELKAVFAGPILDEVYGGKFIGEIERSWSFARWIPLIPPDAMGAAYASADIVLNASFSEGLSNVILEAMAIGRPILASDIAANRRPVQGEKGEPPCGLCFRPGDVENFKRQALALIDDRSLRESLGQAGQKRIAARHRPEDEAAGLIRAYEMAMV